MAHPLTRAHMRKLLLQREFTPLEDEEWDWPWNPTQLQTFLDMWDSGEHIADIAKTTKREVDEVTVLVIALKRKGVIGNREGGAYGNR